jgi:hypothetical protein
MCKDAKFSDGGGIRATPRWKLPPGKISKGTARRFILRRHEDVSGISGTGVVAEGVEFLSGMVALNWFGSHSCVNVYSSMRTVEELHGHQGATQVEWLDA